MTEVRVDTERWNRVIALATEMGYQRALKDVTSALTPTDLPIIAAIAHLCDDSLKRAKEIK